MIKGTRCAVDPFSDPLAFTVRRQRVELTE
jgi:hypothetical protein